MQRKPIGAKRLVCLEAGQATAEYALVLVAAAIVALALISWASTTDALPAFFNSVIQKVVSIANGV